MTDNSTKRRKTTTVARGVHDVMCWVETTPHHTIDTEAKAGHVTLKGYKYTIHIPDAIYANCHMKVADRFDNRMFRWDFDMDALSNTTLYHKE